MHCNVGEGSRNDRGQGYEEVEMEMDVEHKNDGHHYSDKTEVDCSPSVHTHLHQRTAFLSSLMTCLLFLYSSFLL